MTVDVRKEESRKARYERNKKKEEERGRRSQYI
jgi:hypothetical protein